MQADILQLLTSTPPALSLAEAEQVAAEHYAIKGRAKLLVSDKGKWRRTLKPRPGGMDDWTHWRHGPDRNAVSKDTLVDVPGRVQWLFTPREVTERSHVVIAGGRFFAQCKGMLIARDAFNGMLLWKNEVPQWMPEMWPSSMLPPSPTNTAPCVGNF